MHPLLCHEWAVVRGEAALALPGWRDWLMLAVMVALALTLFLGSDVATALLDWRVAAAIGAIAGWVGLRTGRRRLDHLVRESVIAPAALDPVGQRSYATAILLGAALLLTALGALAGPSSVPALLAGLAAGSTFAALLPLRIIPARVIAAQPRPPVASLTPAQAVSSYQLVSRPPWPTVGPLVAALASVALAMALPGGWNPALRLAIPAGSVALTMFALTRVDAACVVFLARTGHGAWRSAGLHLLPAARFAAILLPLLLVGAPHAFLPCASVIAAIAIFTVLRVWSFCAYSKRFADMILLFGAVGGAVLAASFPPLLLPYLVVAGIALLRRAARATWSMA